MRDSVLNNPDTPDVAIIADDLTGACDSGIEFLACSTSVVVLVESESSAPLEARGSIVVYNTQSRKLAREQAYERVLAASRRAVSSGSDIVFKKVDSALRGNFGIEIGAVMDAAGVQTAFILTAIPEAGRETIGGVQHINGVPIADSFYSRDPEHPVVESSVLRRAEEGSGRRAGLVSLEDVRAGKAAEVAERLHRMGCQLIVVDARSVSDLRGAVQGLSQGEETRLFVGCQGLAQALAANLPYVVKIPCNVGGIAGPIFFVCGTLHPRTKRQLEVAANSGNVLRIEKEVSGMTERSDSGANTELAELAETCRSSLLAGKNVAVCLGGTGRALSRGLCSAILDFLSGLARRVVEAAPVGALVLTGGETAYAVCRALEIPALKLRARIAPLVVASEAVGGPCHGTVVVTKGGSIGPDNVFSRIEESLRKET